MIHIIHQLLVFAFIYNGNDLVAFLHIIGADGFINSGSAVQMMKNKFSQFFFMLCNNTCLLYTSDAADD